MLIWTERLVQGEEIGLIIRITFGKNGVRWMLLRFEFALRRQTQHGSNIAAFSKPFNYLGKILFLNT